MFGSVLLMRRISHEATGLFGLRRPRRSLQASASTSGTRLVDIDAGFVCVMSHRLCVMSIVHVCQRLASAGRMVH